MGCGWLGEPLALVLVEKGYNVRGTTTRQTKLESLNSQGIEAHQITLTETGFEGDIETFLHGLDVLIFNIPPGLRRNPKTDFVGKIGQLLKQLRKARIPRLLFISSTTVYGRFQGRVDESVQPEPDNPAAIQILEAENRVWQDRISRSTLIIRMGGLLGPSRHPITTLSGKKALTRGLDPVNLIYLDEAIAILEMALERTGWEGYLNAVHPDHPRKKEFYLLEAKRLGLPLPEFQTEPLKENPKQVLSRFAPELRTVFGKSLYRS